MHQLREPQLHLIMLFYPGHQGHLVFEVHLAVDKTFQSEPVNSHQLFRGIQKRRSVRSRPVQQVQHVRAFQFGKAESNRPVGHRAGNRYLVGAPSRAEQPFQVVLRQDGNRAAPAPGLGRGRRRGMAADRLVALGETQTLGGKEGNRNAVQGIRRGRFRAGRADEGVGGR